MKWDVLWANILEDEKGSDTAYRVEFLHLHLFRVHPCVSTNILLLSRLERLQDLLSNILILYSASVPEVVHFA